MATAFGASYPCFADQEATYAARLPRLNLKDGERIVGFELHVTAGSVDTLSNIPVGWYVSIDNDASWTATLKANVTVGAGALGAGDFETISLRVHKKEFDGIKLSVSGDVSVTKNFRDIRHIRLDQKNIILAPSVGGAGAAQAGSSTAR